MQLWGPFRRWWPLAVVAVLSAIVAVVISRTLFPAGSPNLDEVAYQAQANALVDGRLTLPTEEFVPSFRPYLSGIDGDAVVFKYQPLWPALMAASQWSTGSTLPLRALLAALGVVACAAFANELFGSRRVATIAESTATTASGHQRRKGPHNCTGGS